jgi:phospholipase C
MENHNWSDILGSKSAPYMNGTLLPQSSYCDQYFDNPLGIHPSEPNYIWLEAGDTLGIKSDADPSAVHSLDTTEHLVTQLKTAGVTWRSYQEDLPAGHCGTKSTGLYAAKHNPMVFFQDVSGNPPSDTNEYCIQNVVPYTQLDADLNANTVARYNFITPNMCNDMHDNCSGDAVAQGDSWLASEVPKILASQAYKEGGAIFITWDESEGGEYPIGMIVLSPRAKGGGYVSHTKYFHSSMLRTVEEIFGVPLLRDAQKQPSLADLFVAFP